MRDGGLRGARISGESRSGLSATGPRGKRAARARARTTFSRRLGEGGSVEDDKKAGWRPLMECCGGARGRELLGRRWGDCIV